MENDVGVVETKEAILAIAELGLFVASRARDGVGFDDLAALITKFVMEPEFKAKLEAGAKGLDAVPVEIQNISIQEALELVGLIVELFKKVK